MSALVTLAQWETWEPLRSHSLIRDLAGRTRRKRLPRHLHSVSRALTSVALNRLTQFEEAIVLLKSPLATLLLSESPGLAILIFVFIAGDKIGAAPLVAVVTLSDLLCYRLTLGVFVRFDLAWMLALEASTNAPSFLSCKAVLLEDLLIIGLGVIDEVRDVAVVVRVLVFVITWRCVAPPQVFVALFGLFIHKS